MTRPSKGTPPGHAAAPALRAGLYYRVSSEEQVEGYSLDAQQRAARAYCAAQGWTVAEEYRDEGKSARTDDVGKRPAFQRMILDAEAGLLDVLVVHKLDRFARNLRVTLETLDRLDRHRVGFVSISESMDFTTPIGRVILATLGAFAQYYSDNLSHETKKGKAERKAQGLYNGLLPFGVKKNADGLPVPDPDTYPGLLLAFKTAAQGANDRQVAIALNEAGYRTTGNRGAQPFTRDTVRRILMNRFYLGELPDGQGGWLPGRQAPMLDSALFAAVEQARDRNRLSRNTTRRQAQVFSLSGVAVCGHCGGRIHLHRNGDGRPRVYCYQGHQAEPCAQRSTLLDVYEAQIAEYLATFHLPDDYQARILALSEQADRDRAAARRRREITARLDRIKELYRWGDLEREAYQRERDGLTAELATLRGAEDQSAALAQTAAFLRDFPAAWAQATQEERDRLARLLFHAVELNDDRVAAVIPQPDFAPFFVLDCQTEDEKSIMRKRRDSNPRSQP